MSQNQIEPDKPLSDILKRIVQVTGCPDGVAPQVADYMRGQIFRDELEDQPQDALDNAAWTAWEDTTLLRIQEGQSEPVYRCCIQLINPTSDQRLAARLAPHQSNARPRDSRSHGATLVLVQNGAKMKIAA